MISKPTILFIIDKFSSAKREYGVAEWETNLYKSLEFCDLAEVQTFHFDDYFLTRGKPADAALLEAVEKNKPNMICLVVYTTPDTHYNVPTFKTLTILRDRFQIPMLAIWGDIQMEWQLDLSKALLPYVTANIATASSAAVRRAGNPEKYTYAFVPKNGKYFFNPKEPRDISISYVGTPKADRLARVNHLKQNGLSVYSSGGEQGVHLDVADFGRILMRSKITLGFSRSTYLHVINARTFEATLCGAMLLEEEGFETPKLFTPYVDYVPFTSDQDLLEKARYYLENEAERILIAESGWKKAQELFSAERFWRLAIDKTLYPNTEGLKTWKPKNLSFATLNGIPKPRALKLMLLERIYGEPLLFSIYSLVNDIRTGAPNERIKGSARNLLNRCLPKSLFEGLLSLKRRILKKS